MTFEDEDTLVARLVRAGQADGPSARSLEAAPVAVAALLSSSLAHAALGSASTALAAPASKAALSPLVMVKWIAVGTIASSSVLAIANAPELLQSRATTRAAAQPLPAAPAQPARKHTRASVELALPVPAPPPSTSPAMTSASAPHADVAVEVSLLDAARDALVAGNSAEALRLLASLERVPGRALVPEATVLRVRALLSQGKTTEAVDVTERFCASAETSPQCVLLRTLLSKSVIQAPSPRL